MGRRQLNAISFQAHGHARADGNHLGNAALPLQPVPSPAWAPPPSVSPEVETATRAIMPTLKQCGGLSPRNQNIFSELFCMRPTTDLSLRRASPDTSDPSLLYHKGSQHLRFLLHHTLQTQTLNRSWHLCQPTVRVEISLLFSAVSPSNPVSGTPTQVCNKHLLNAYVNNSITKWEPSVRWILLILYSQWLLCLIYKIGRMTTQNDCKAAIDLM